MTRLVKGDAALLVSSHYLGLLLQSAYNSIYGVKEILLADCLLVVAGCDESCLVADIRNISTREARSLTSQQIYIHGLVNLDRLQVNQEDGLALVQARKIYVDFSVETACAEQGTVEHIHTVGSSQDNHTTVGAETIHLGEQGVKRVLSLIISAHGWVLAAGTTHGVDLIDEDDARRFLLCLAEEVANTRCTYADKHFNEVGTAHREERNASFSSHRLRQKSLTGSWRTYEQGALRNLTTQVGVFLRILQKIHYFLYFLLGTFLSGNVLEGNADGISLLIHLRLALSYVEDATAHVAHSVAHSARHPVDEEEEEEQWGEAHDEAPEVVVLLVVITEGTDFSFFHHQVAVAVNFVDGSELYFYVWIRTHALGTQLIYIARIFWVDVYLEVTLSLVCHHAEHVALVHVLLELGVGSFLGCASAQGISTTTEEQRDERYEDDGVEPIHVKPRHLRTISSARVV